jgi:hypothetical protein
MARTAPVRRLRSGALGWIAMVGLVVASAVATPGVASAATIHLSPDRPTICDPIDPRDCLLPFPDDFFTVADSSTATGRRVAFDPAAMPKTVNDVGIDPTEWNRNDGFSPGSLVTLFVPGVDVARSGLAPITDKQRSLDADAPIVIVDADTGQRQPY